MKGVIIEDDIKTVTIIKDIIHQNDEKITIIGNASSVNDGIILIKSTHPDFIFLDINLDDGLGFDILKSFPAPTFKIIFITSYSKYAVEAFKFSALDYILKPFTATDITEAIKKVVKEKHSKNYIDKIATLYHNHISSNKKIVLSNAENIFIVSVEDIIYAESDNSYTTFYIKNSDAILVSKSLKSFENKLSQYLFFRIHQKYLINLKHLKKYYKKNDEAILLNNISLPVSRAKREHLLNVLKNF